MQLIKYGNISERVDKGEIGAGHVTVKGTQALYKQIRTPA